MKLTLNLRSVDARLYLEFLDTSIQDWESWLKDVPASADDKEQRRETWRVLRLLRRLRVQVAEQLEAA